MYIGSKDTVDLHISMSLASLKGHFRPAIAGSELVGTDTGWTCLIDVVVPEEGKRAGEGSFEDNEEHHLARPQLDCSDKRDKEGSDN